VVHTCFEPLTEWQRVASNAQGEPLACGHYIAEEVPELLLARISPFLSPDEAQA
jgi:haloacetate dehalogenase